MKYIYENSANCPVTKAMTLIGGRWKFIILYTLRKSPKRFGQINNLITSISNKVLSEQLKELEDDELIIRTVLSDRIPVNVLYSLSAKGEKLIPVIEALESWGENLPNNLNEV